MTKYKTKQKQAILNFLEINKNQHLTIENIENSLKKSDISVGKVTIYRCIDNLVRDGKVRKFLSGHGEKTCYQLILDDCVNQYHLKCDICEELFHLECNYIEEISTHINTMHNFIINATKTVFHGICEKCTAQQKGEQNV